MNAFGRIALCGMISGYNGEPIPLQQPQLILQSRLRVEGFIVSEHMEVWPEALKELGTLVASGKLKYRETIAEGIERRPRHSSACSRVGTSASSSSSWSERMEAAPRGEEFRDDLRPVARSARRHAATPRRAASWAPTNWRR